MSLEYTHIFSALVGDAALSPINGGSPVVVRTSRTYSWSIQPSFLSSKGVHSKLLIRVSESINNVEVMFIPVFYLPSSSPQYELWGIDSSTALCVRKSASGSQTTPRSDVYITFYTTDNDSVSIAQHNFLPTSSSTVLKIFDETVHDTSYWTSSSSSGDYAINPLAPPVYYYLEKRDTAYNFSPRNISYTLKIYNATRTTQYNVCSGSESSSVIIQVPAYEAPETTSALYTKVDGMWLPCRMLTKRNGEWVSSSN